MLLPNAESPWRKGPAAFNYIETQLTSIDRIERLTDLDFLRDLPNARENAVEKTTASELWTCPSGVDSDD